MNTSQNLSHDAHLFSRMTDILVMSGTGKHHYGVDIPNLGILASVMNQLGMTNKLGQNLNANSLKQVIFRMKHSSSGLNDFSPDWSEFDEPDALSHSYENIVHMRSDLSDSSRNPEKILH